MIRWLLTCEHGGNQVPEPWRGHFAGAEAVLASHRGWDRGSLAIMEALEPEIADAAFAARVTRLLVDLNRSVGHRHVFSEFTRVLPRRDKQAILDGYYHPWRDAVTARLDGWLRQGAWVLHVSVHSFTASLDGQRRNADIGLLYDPGRPLERAFCRSWRDTLKEMAPSFRVRMNYPYRGTADGFTRWLRRRHPRRYAGVELELNEGTLADRGPDLAAAIVASSRTLKAGFDPAAAPAD